MSHVLLLIGGLGFFLYGMQLCSDALKNGAGRRTRAMIGSLTRSRARSVFFGIGATVLTQSAGAASVFVVSLVNTSLVPLAASGPILIGAGIGTCATVQLIAFRVSEYALLPVAAGILLMLFFRSEKIRLAGSVVLGFGLIFFGMELMSQGVRPWMLDPAMPSVIAWLASYPWLALLASTLFAMVIQSSGAVIGLLMSLGLAGGGHDGVRLLEAMLPLVLGANLGPCVTAFIATVGVRREARRVAILQVVQRSIIVLLLMPLVGPLARLIDDLSGADTARALANAHTAYHFLATLLLVPFAGQLAGLTRRIYPLRGDDHEYGCVNLDANLVTTPGLALAAVRQETIRMAGLVERQVDQLMACFVGNACLRETGQVERGDARIDRMQAEITRYLNAVLASGSSREASGEGERLFFTVASLESIGDIVVKNVMPLARKYCRAGEPFSGSGLQEIIELHADIVGLQRLLVGCLAAGARTDWLALGEKCERTSDRIDGLRQRHLARIVAGERQSLDTSAIHLDLVENLRRIENVIKHIARIHLKSGGIEL